MGDWEESVKENDIYSQDILRLGVRIWEGVTCWQGGAEPVSEQSGD